jgi:hypothetical protein
MAAAVQMMVVVTLPRMIWQAGVFELNRDASLLVTRERADDWLLRKDSDDKQQLQQQKRMCAHEAPNHATAKNLSNISKHKQEAPPIAPPTPPVAAFLEPRRRDGETGHAGTRLVKPRNP